MEKEEVVVTVETAAETAETEELKLGDFVTLVQDNVVQYHHATLLGWQDGIPVVKLPGSRNGSYMLPPGMRMRKAAPQKLDRRGRGRKK